MTIDSFDVVYYTCIFILPGFIMRAVIDAITPSGRTSDSKYYLSCLAYSIVNCAVWSWIYKILNDKVYGKLYWIEIVLVTIIGAVIVATFIGIIKQSGIIKKLLNKVKINISNPIPTSWDYFFSKQKSNWIVVTLVNGKSVMGFYSFESFASSDPEERDIFIEEVYDVNDEYKWIKNEKSKGILISKDQISTIEFLSS